MSLFEARDYYVSCSVRKSDRSIITSQESVPLLSRSLSARLTSYGCTAISNRYPKSIEPDAPGRRSSGDQLINKLQMEEQFDRG